MLDPDLLVVALATWRWLERLKAELSAFPLGGDTCLVGFFINVSLVLLPVRCRLLVYLVTFVAPQC